MNTLRDIPCSIIQTADILAWDFVQSMLCKTFDPTLEDTDNCLSHVEDNIRNQLKVDRSTLLVNWKLVEGLINDVTKVT